MGITILENWALDPCTMIRWVLDPRRYSFYIYFGFCFTTYKENLQILTYKNIKNTVKNPKKLPEWHRIGKRLKYPWISLKNYENAPGGACSSRAVTVGGGEIFGEISGQRMVDSGRSEGEDSDDGGFDDRWWLMRENRWFEAWGGRRNRGLFPARWGG